LDGGQQQRDQDSNDRDHNQKLDERKAPGSDWAGRNFGTDTAVHDGAPKQMNASAGRLEKSAAG
jgi:hypothetical protein